MRRTQRTPNAKLSDQDYKQGERLVLRQQLASRLRNAYGHENSAISDHLSQRSNCVELKTRALKCVIFQERVKSRKELVAVHIPF